MPSILSIADSTPVSNLNPNAFEKLVQGLSAVLGPSSGLGPEDVNPLIIQKLMESYVSDESEWASFALRDESRAYTRNLIDEGNGKSNLLILVWTPGKGSAIHDHANSHCVMKILKGKLQETLYTWPDEKKINKGEISPLMITKQTIYHENQVTYISDEVSSRSVFIVSATPIQKILPFRFIVSHPWLASFSVTVALNADIEPVYTPPSASIHGVHIFNEGTGKSTHIKMSNFYSVRGKRTTEIGVVDKGMS